MRKKKKRSHPYRLLLFFLYLTLCTIFIFLVVRLLEAKVLPTMKKIAEYELSNTINTLVNEAVKETVRTYDVTSADFIEMTLNGIGDISFLSSNTLLINALCADVSANITARLSDADDFFIAIPLGVLSGLEILSNVGPKINMHIVPYGTAKTEYGTSFSSTGINQTNFIIWLDTEIQMEPVIPLFNDLISIKRKITLVNSVINGNVPSTYLNGPLGL